MLFAAACAIAACSADVASAQRPPDAATLVGIATRTAAVDGRHVIVKFRASWCEWCARLDAALHSLELGRLVAEHFVLVDMTVQEDADKKALETPGADELMEETGGAQAGLPYYVILDATGRAVANSMRMPGGSNIGYPVTDEEIDAFGALLAETVPGLSEEDRKKVADYFERHAP